MTFLDRGDAGRRLAALLGPLLANAHASVLAHADHADHADTVVMGMARGGVPVAFEVARVLGVPLDVVVVRKLGHPRQPELGLGAIAEDGVRLVNAELVATLEVGPEIIEAVAAREGAELERRVAAYRGDRPVVPVEGKTVIVVDDGLATGFTARAAVAVMRGRGAARVVVAVPVGPPATLEALGEVADDVMCVEPTTRFVGISEWYEDFHQVSDEEVARLLAEAAAGVVIKYLGSKRRLVPVLGELAQRAGARRALDLFTGTTRVAQEFKRSGAEVTAVDSTRYAAVLAQCYVATDLDTVDTVALEAAVAELNAVPGEPGYVTEVFCERSRFFQPANGARIDAVRRAIARDYAGSPLEPVLLTSLLEAADRVDSTTGVQMAYVKQWSDRSFRPLELRVPVLLSGPGHAVRGDACALAADLGPFDLAYLDPPYNQHRYESNYHIWETLVAWDAPEHYGVACKRTELREGGRSAFNSRRTMAGALRQVVGDVRARLVVLSYNDESWVRLEELVEMCAVRGHVEVLGFASNRYVGARIGIHNPAGERVGSVGRLRNLEYVVVAGERDEVRHAVAPWRDAVVGARAS